MTTPNQEFNAARHDPSRIQRVEVVGSRPARRRPVTSFLKLSVIAGVLWAGGKMVSGFMGHEAATADAVSAQPATDVPTHAQAATPATSQLPAHVEIAPRASFDDVQSSVRVVPGVASAPTADQPVSLASIRVEQGDTHNDLVRKYQNTGMRTFETAFEALSVQAEGMELKPYNAGENRNPTNVTIGVGYHIPSNLRQLGRDHVISEFRQAGISQSVAEDLVSQDAARLAKVEITPTQALSLLAVTMPRYKADVVGRIGENNWKKLGRVAGPEGQAGVVWSAYNGAFWQHVDQTVSAIRSGDRLAIANSIYGTAKINGRSQQNHNLSLARAAVASRDTFNYAVGYGNRAGAHARVDSLIASTQPTPVRPAPDMVAQGQMTAVDVVPASPPPPSPRTVINPSEFENVQVVQPPPGLNTPPPYGKYNR